MIEKTYGISETVLFHCYELIWFTIFETKICCFECATKYLI